LISVASLGTSLLSREEMATKIPILIVIRMKSLKAKMQLKTNKGLRTYICNMTN